ncbi:MAG: hypothetical protein H6974_13440 [Gammaproteobacteria bacterium]|nr:hypothetical protein [Gammaproteobacteria bacterium]MCP5197767.1 hypothetical protein [Gammaproteobacteria bacterium]
MRQRLLSLLRIAVLLPSALLVMSIRLIKWSIAPLALLIQMLIGVPLTLLRVRQPVRPHFISLTEAKLPNAAWIALTDSAEALTADGFIHQGDFRCDEMILNAVLWLRLLAQHEQGIKAMIAYVQFKTGGHPCQQFASFSTDFADGRVLDTNNLNLPYSLPAPAYLARLQLKDVWEPRALYVLHRELVKSLSQSANQAGIKPADSDLATFLADSYTREIQALTQQGWLRRVADQNQVHLSFWGALIGIWRQAWPLASLYLRAADRRSRQLLAARDIDVAKFTGGAISIIVDRQPLPAETGAITTISAGYEYAQSLAQHTDPGAILESVVVELDLDATGAVALGEFRYSFRNCKHQSERRIRRLRSFDILLDPTAGLMAVTAMEREAEQAADESEWQSMLKDSPSQPPLRLGPWLCDLDTVLPIALKALNACANTQQHIQVDSASLYTDEDGTLRWQVVAWMENDTPLHVMVDARNGTIIDF